MQRLKLSMVVPLLYVAVALVGCGGGSLSGGNNGGGGNGNGGSGSNNASPTISSVSPTFVPAGSQNQTVTITGTNFVTGSYVGWSSGGGQPQTLGGTLVSSTELQISLSAPSIGGVYQLTVTNPSPGGGTSAPANFTVVGFVNAANLNTATASQTATLLANGEVMVAGGDGGSCFSNGNPTGPGNCYTATTASEVYSPSANSFSLIHSMNTARTIHTATLLPNGSVLIAGGGASGAYCNTSPTATAELYNPTTQVFVNTGSMLTARMCATATLLPNGKVLIAGGDDGTQSLASAEVYDPATGTFTLTGSMTTARENHTATLLPNGQVLIAGGADASGAARPPLSSAELYNPATGTFTATSQGMITSRFYHTATLLPDGQVLISGGEKDTTGSSLIDTAELYNPATDTFSSTGNSVKARSDHTATLLANGQVLLVGGSYENTAELYDPTAGTFAATASTNVALGLQTATMLPSLQPLIVGGFNLTKGGQVPNSELFVPPPVQTPLVPTATAVSPSSASPGSVVVLQGSSFLPNSSISFDGQAVPTTYLDETLLSFTIPTSASVGNHSLVVNDPAGGASGSVTMNVN
jgi:hypothetical protein